MRRFGILPDSRRAAWLVGVLVVAIAVGGGYSLLRTPPRSPTAAVHDFVRDLNTASARDLGHDLYAFKPVGAFPGSADPADVISHARRPWKVSLLQISDGTKPQIAMAQILGTAGGTRLQVKLPLIRQHGRWYVMLTSDKADVQGS